MTLTFARLLADAWHLFRRDRDLILRLALPFLFLPAYAALLLCDPIPPLPPSPRDQPMIEAWLNAVADWGQANGIWYVAADAAGVVGLAAIAVLLLDLDRPFVGGALRQAGVRFLVFAIATLLVALPVGLGMWLFLLPGLWVQGRLSAALPLLATRRVGRATRAVALSWRATRGHGFALAGAVVTAFLAQWVTVAPLLSADEWLRVPGHENPVVLAVVDAIIAAAGAGYHLAVLMIGIAAYRRLASSGT